jgi:hypothetical protein
MTGNDPSDATESLLARVAEIWTGLVGADPERLAADTRSSYSPASASSGEFGIPVWGRDARVTFPEFATTWADDGHSVDPFTAALLAYHFQTSDGTPETGHRIAFQDLQDGTFYARAFQSYTGRELEKGFGNDTDAFATAATALGGLPEAHGDRGFSFRVLPLVSVAIACWRGDEDFGPSYRVLFDAAVGRHLPTDVCAIVGGNLTRRLLAARPA